MDGKNTTHKGIFMDNNYRMIEDIFFLNDKADTKDKFIDLFEKGYFSDESLFEELILNNEINGLMDGISSRMKYSMSKFALGIYNVLDKGPGKNLTPEDEIYLFSGFTEIEAVNKIGKLIMEEDYKINPALFPNSVNHIALCYYTIFKKISNYTVAITDGINTNYSFINFINNMHTIKQNYIIATGEIQSDFFTYESDNELKISPSFAAYKVGDQGDNGFRFIEKCESLDAFIKKNYYNTSQSIFCDRDSFTLLKKTGKNLYTDYPINKENPCGIAMRLAFPFYFDIKGKSLVIDKFKEIFYIYEVIL